MDDQRPPSAVGQSEAGDQPAASPVHAQHGAPPWADRIFDSHVGRFVVGTSAIVGLLVSPLAVIEFFHVRHMDENVSVVSKTLGELGLGEGEASDLIGLSERVARKQKLLNEEMAALQKDNFSLASQANDLASKLRSAQQTIVALASQVMALQDDKLVIEAQADKLARQLDTMRRDNATLIAQAATLQAEKTALVSKTEDLARQVQVAQQGGAALAAQVTDLNKANAALMARIDDITSKLQSKALEVQKLQTSLEAVMREKAKLEASLRVAGQQKVVPTTRPRGAEVARAGTPERPTLASSSPMHGTGKDARAVAASPADPNDNIAEKLNREWDEAHHQGEPRKSQPDPGNAKLVASANVVGVPASSASSSTGRAPTGLNVAGSGVVPNQHQMSVGANIQRRNTVIINEDDSTESQPFQTIFTSMSRNFGTVNAGNALISGGTFTIIRPPTMPMPGVTFGRTVVLHR